MAGQPRIILSARPNEGEQNQLLRPKMLDEYVVPNVGLIMYGFFWIKFGMWLHSQGLDPDEQSELLLWTRTQDGTVVFKESILYYSLRLRSVDPATSNIPGKQITSGWLFAKQPSGTDQYDRTIEEIETAVQEPDTFDGEQFTEAVVAPWFRTRCHEYDVDLPTRLDERLGRALTEASADDRQAVARVIEAFVTTIGEICYAHPDLYQGYNTAPINEPFDLTAMLWETGAPARDTLANRRVELTQRDVDALFTILTTFPQGIRMLHSFCFMAYVGPYDGAEDRLREIYSICREQASEIITTAEKHFNQTFDPAVMVDIVETSFYYELNYVLAESETIARKLLADREGLIRLQEIEDFLDDRASSLPVDRLRTFVGAPESVQEYLPGLIEKYDADGEADVVSFLTRLQETIAAGNEPAAVLAELLIQQGTLSEFKGEEGIYRIERPPETTSSATFYGTSSMLTYTRELLEAATHE